MKRAARQIAICAAVLLAVCIICRLTVVRNYTAYIPLPMETEDEPGADAVAENEPGAETAANVPEADATDNGKGTDAAADAPGVDVEVDAPEVAEIGEPTRVRNVLRVPVQPEGEGWAVLTVRDDSGEAMTEYFLRVGPLDTIYDAHSGGFTGDSVVMVALSIFWAAVFVIMLRAYRQNRGPAYYAYSTIYAAGFSIFAFVTALLTTVMTVAHFVDPIRYNMLTVYGVVSGADRQFMMLTLPLVVAFAVAVAVSNIALLRHASFRWQNVLGILLAILLIGGEAVEWLIFLSDFSGSEMQWRVHLTVQNAYATAFSYVECMLAGSVICGLRAARHEPEKDKDFIVILGCWFRPDGTLPPLLKGRVDRAISFWRAQRETSGKEAILIPSGGQGANETMAEGEAMRRYLLTQGIPERAIRPELQSANTYQNMEFSKKIVDEIDPVGKVIFSTTNYHVFRSGVWASRAGLPSEGIGSRTKWWYWPNAFLRECVGLLVRRWKQEVLLLAILVGFFGALSMVLG